MIDSSQPIYKLIEFHALTQPNKLAVICEESALTYAELNSRANSLARHLIERKIIPGSRVAVYISPSTNILVSILAIHKVGCAYIPLDQNFPPARIRAILNEVKPSCILYAEQIEGIPTEFSDICLNLKVVEAAEYLSENPNVFVGLEDISHIYFTSGTTGIPKGVLSTHQNLIHYILTAIKRYQFNGEDIFLAAARFTFSISMFELMVPLVVGGSVKVLPRDTVLDLGRLSRAVASATVFHFGPSLLKQLLPYIEKTYLSFDPFDRLTHVSSGGDMVPPEILEKLKRIFRNAEVFVIYGSSEISCMGCTYEVPRNITLNRTLVGKPHHDVMVKILDKNGNMVPVAEPGQIYFSGKGLVKGYLNLPELTLEKFTMIDGERFYAIGDIGRYDLDGNIELLGREDFQVQIRGMRIEILEVESCLKKISSILDCVVVGRALKEDDEKSLIAYLVFRHDEKIVASEIKQIIAEQLPDYMIPAVFVRLDKLPTNFNAKLDRSQLPYPNVENIIFSDEYQIASNDVEKALIDIWERLFSLNNIGINHNFFELGGDSLLAVNFLIEIENRFGKFIPISMLLDAPTIRDIALIILSTEAVGNIGGVVVLKKGNTEPPLFCLYGVMLYKDLANCLDTKRMVCGVYLEEEVSLIHKGRDSEEFKIFSSVDKIANRYLASIRAYQAKGPYFLCGESFGGITALEVARKLEQEGEVVQCLAMFDTNAPGYFNSLARAKRFRIHLHLIKKMGLGYIRLKLIEYLKQLVVKVSLFFGNQSTLEVKDIRDESRNLAVKNYTPAHYQGEVMLFRAKERTSFDLGLEDLGWGKFIQKLKVHHISGDHLGILKRGHVEQIADVLREKMK